MTDWKKWATKVGIRTLRTFIQAFLGVLVASGAGMIEVNVIQNALVSGLVAGVTALQNGLEEWTPNNKG
jgi:Flp pilus assembly pilin Flp